VSDLFSLVFAYKSFFQITAPVSNSIIVEQRALIRYFILFFWSEGAKAPQVQAEASDAQKAHRFADQGFFVRHDNARPHFAAATSEAIRQQKFKLLPNPHILRT
jgi:hypothetical protein